MKKLSRKLLMSLIAVLFAFAALGTSTFAWFSMNDTVTATGMQVKAVAEGALVIQNDATKLGVSFGTEGSVSFGSTVYTLKPATHDDKYDGTNATSKGLKYCNNSKQVDTSTGVAKSGKTLTYADAATEATSTSSGYYKDYVVYIASATEDLNAKTLKVYLSATANTDTKKALSVDFYVATKVSEEGKFCGTLNLTALTSGKTAELELKHADLASYKIPLYTETGSDNVCKVTMRVYFDGAKTYTGNVNYVLVSSENSNNTWAEGTKYYTISGSNYIETAVADQATLNAGTYYVAGGTATLAYIRSSTVDTTDLSFTADFALTTNN